MTIQLNKTLRPLRLKAGLTQSALAEKLGVSDGAVSRWETGEAYPDVTLLPALSMLLGVSVDALLGVDSQRRKEAIDSALAACSDAMQNGQAPEAVCVMREALRAWPDEPELMVNLARALMGLHTEEAAHEALALCRAADGKPARLSTQYGCKQTMALALHRLGKAAQAAQLVSDELPSFWACREILYPRVAPPDMAEGQRQFNLLWLADQMYFTLREMSKAQPAHAAGLLSKAVHIYREVTGETAGPYEERICQAWGLIARHHAEAGRTGEALTALQNALNASEAFAAHDGHFSAPWLSLKRQGEPAVPQQTKALRDHLRKLMSASAFDECRNSAEFAAIAQRLATD